MTTEQTMLNSRVTWIAWARSRLLTGAMVLAALAVGRVLIGCAGPDNKLAAPRALVAPYDVSRGEAMWAVVPLRNESGTTIADSYLVSDKVVAAASQVRGIRCLPLNRTIGVMRSLDMTDLTKPEDAEALARALGVDGLIVGTITAYDPYNPPRLGLALALYTRPGFNGRPATASGLDPRKLTYQPTDYKHFPRSAHGDAPASVISEFLDGKNHQVLMDIQSYAQGRHDETSALGWRRFLASMDLFCEFSAWHGVNRLLEHEWIRMARVPAETNQQP